ncbi:phospholipase D family protein [Methanobrevibacter millerae]|uniref:PLD-like domain-containing protein n=1 Tax=Methanobrevibacter millerae TaxID=230361 RepID=A0A0U3CGS0_9EURY|nr:phospholipase D family protein [Methanobrevibacter millerae]ALT69003.1 hypothetical protein sm9_1222 [Methanobrevibacter millerae]
MLNPKKDRLDYGSILSPPQNYQLDFAIGATYSLDLDALVGASISLGLSAENDTELNKNPIFLLEALRSTGDKIALFCESGQIKLPNKTTTLYILLEDMVFQVTNSNNVEYSRYASFHPKVWVLRYINDKKEILYRFAVLSRNLTFDRNWDLSFSMDGSITDSKTDKNNPLIKFLEFLSGFSTDGDKTDKIREIMNELENVEFKLDSNVFEGFDFILNGVGAEYSIQNHQLFYSNSLENLLIMSPFLSKDVIIDFNNRKKPNSKAILITRLNSLSPLKDKKLDNFEFYALKDDVVDGESLLSEEYSQKQDIHAKMYIVEKRNYVDLYLGSLNASHNALFGNVEFMIKLWAKKRRFNINKVLKNIFNDGKDNPFQMVNMDTIKSEPENDGNDLNLIVKQIVRLNSSANVISRNDSFDLEVEFDKDYDDYDIEIQPLLSNKKVKFSRKIIFKDLDKVQLSEFFIITITKDDDSIRRIIKIPVDNLPEDRQNDVVSNIINDKTAFIRYVAFLLGDEYILSSIEDGDYSSDKSDTNFTVELPELYEKMLKAAMYEPEKFSELEFLIKTLSKDNVIPEGFEELHDTFKRVINDE